MTAALVVVADSMAEADAIAAWALGAVCARAGRLSVARNGVSFFFDGPDAAPAVDACLRMLGTVAAGATGAGGDA